MSLCGGLFIYNWFKHHRAGRWPLAVVYPFLMLAAWEVHDSWNDVLPNLILFVGLTLFSGATGTIANKRREAEKKVRQESEEELRSTRLLVASELHDNVAQTQALLVMGLENFMDDPGLPDSLHPELLEVLELSRRSATELRAAMAALRNVDQDFSSFGIQSGHPLKEQWPQVLDALQDSGFTAKTRFDITTGQISPELEHTISRILGELVTNLVWYGAPGACTVEVLQRNGWAVIRAINEINPTAPAKSCGGGHGLLGVKERVDLLNGTYSFASEGHQWHAEVRIPLAIRPGG